MMGGVSCEFDGEVTGARAGYLAGRLPSAESYMARTGTWAAASADVTVLGPRQRGAGSRVDVRDGTRYRVDSETGNLTPEEMIRRGVDVINSDRADAANFANRDVLETRQLDYVSAPPSNRAWVRKWKWKQAADGKCASAMNSGL